MRKIAFVKQVKQYIILLCLLPFLSNVSAQILFWESITTTYGADPNDNLSDDAAFRAAVANIQSRGGHTELTIEAASTPGGHYIIGKEESGFSDTEPFYRSLPNFSLDNCKSVIIQGYNSKYETILPVIKMNSGFHVGLYGVHGEEPLSPGAWNILQQNGCAGLVEYIHSVDYTNPSDCGPNLSWSYSFIVNRMNAAPKPIFEFINCTDITVKNIEIDGNSFNQRYGGEYGIGHPAYEFRNHGFYMRKVLRVTLDNVQVHDMIGDGFQLENLYGTSKKSDDGILVTNCSFNRNGRNGISWVGGKGFTMKNTQCNNNAPPDGKVNSSPGAGFSLEPETGDPVNGVISDCDFMGNKGHGLVLPSSGPTHYRSGGHRFTNCNTGNSTNYSRSSDAARISQHNTWFTNCNFYGSTVADYTPPEFVDVAGETALVFKDCLFTDCYNGNLVYGSTYCNAYFNSPKAEVVGCRFFTYNPSLEYNAGFQFYTEQPVDNYMQVSHSTFTKFNTNPSAVYGGFFDRTRIWRSSFNQHNTQGNPLGQYVFNNTVIPTPVGGHIDHLDGNTENYNYQPDDCEISCVRESTTPTISPEGSVHFCYNDYNIRFQLTTTSPNAIWHGPGVEGQVGTNVMVIQPGDYYVTVNDNCGNIASNHFLVITDYPLNIPVLEGPELVCPGQPIQYSVEYVGSGGMYTWDVPAGATIVSPNPLTDQAYYVSILFDQGFDSGDIHVRVNNSCNEVQISKTVTNAYNCFARSTAAIPGKTSNPGNIVYPNPSAGDFKIILQETFRNDIVNVEILNEFGAIVYKRSEKANNNTIEMKLNGKLTSGIYTINCYSNKDRAVYKIVIVK